MLETLLSYDDVNEKSVLRLSCLKKDHGNITADCPTATHANRGLEVFYSCLTRMMPSIVKKFTLVHYWFEELNL